MFGEKFVEFNDNLIKCSQLTKEKITKNKNCGSKKEEELINEYNLNDKSKLYIEKHITTLIDTSIKKFLQTYNNSQKYSYYLKFIQNIYCDISDLSNYFPIFKSLKMTLKLYFIIMRTYYYNNQKLEKILINQEKFSTFIDYFFKEMILYTIKIFPNIDIDNKKSISELNIYKEIHNNFVGKGLPFVENDDKEINNGEEKNFTIPINILYNITDYRHDIMKDIENNGFNLKKYFEKQENSLNLIECKEEKDKEKIYLGIIIYFLNEIKERYFVDRFIKYIEVSEEDKKIILNNINIK